MNGAKKNCITGRMIIVHADRDDLGHGGDAESLKTGNAGKRVGCGVIGLSENPNQEMKSEDFKDSLSYIGFGVLLGALSGFLISKI